MTDDKKTYYDYTPKERLQWQLPDIPVGAFITFAREKRPYRVRARSGRFIVCTKPFNPKKTVLYTVIDLVENVRGPEDLVFGMGAETDQQCWDMVDRLDGRDANHPQGLDVRDLAQWEEEKHTLTKDLQKLAKPGRSFRTEVSHRHRVDLDVVGIRIPKSGKPF
jgi:hypothetical protein